MMPDATNNNVNAKSAILVAIVVAALALPTFIGLQTLYHVAREPEASIHPIASAVGQRGGFAWIDRDKGVVRIPVELAMKLIVKESVDQRPSN